MNLNDKIKDFRTVASSYMHEDKLLYQPGIAFIDLQSSNQAISLTVFCSNEYEITTLEQSYIVNYMFTYTRNLDMPILVCSIGPESVKFKKVYKESYTNQNEILDDFLNMFNSYQDILNEKNKDLANKKFQQLIKVNKISDDFT